MAISPVPFRSVLAKVGNLVLYLSEDWQRWFREVKDAVDAGARGTGTPANLTAQSAAIPATTLLAVTATGLYRVSNYLRITRAASGSSSATVTVRYTDGGVACSFAGAAVTGNTTSSVQTSVRLIRADQGTAITIEVAYASVGFPTMTYALDARVESLP